MPFQTFNRSLVEEPSPAGQVPLPEPAAPVTRPSFDPASATLVSSFDPSTAKPVSSFDPGSATLDRAQSLSVDELAKDSSFSPDQYLVNNEAQVLADPALLDKLVRVSMKHEENGLSVLGVAKEAGKAALSVPGAAFGMAKGVVKAGFSPITSAVGLVSETGGKFLEETLGLPGIVKTASSVAAGVETGAMQGADLLRKGGNKAVDIFTSGIRADPYKYAKDRLFENAAVLKQLGRVSSGESGIVGDLRESVPAIPLPDPEITEAASFASNPVNYVPLHAAGVAARGGISKVIGKIPGVTAVGDAAGNLLSKESVGSAIGAVGGAIAKTGKVSEKVADIAALTTAAGSGLVPGVAVRAIPKVLAKSGEAITAVGERLAAGKYDGLLKAGAVFVNNPVTRSAAGGAAVGTLFGLVEENDLSAGGAIGTVAGFGGLVGLPVAAKRTGQAVGAAVQHRAWREELKTPVESPGYGSYPELDQMNSARSAALKPTDRNALNRYRETVRGKAEVYGVSGEYYFDITETDTAGVTVPAPEFDATGNPIPVDQRALPVVLINLDYGLVSGPHEVGGHIIQNQVLTDAARNTWLQKITSEYSPEELAAKKVNYERQINENRDPSLPKIELTLKKVAEELGAEILGNAFRSDKLSGEKPGVVKLATRAVDAFLQKTGIFDPTAPGALRTPLGDVLRAGSAREAANLVQAAQEAPSAITVNPATPAANIPVNPTARQNLPFNPVLTPGLNIPVAGASPAGNIRTTPAAQANLAQAESVTAGIQAARVALSGESPQTRKDFEDVASAISRPQGEVTPIAVDYYSVTPKDIPSENAIVRLTEREAAYLKENLGAAPDSVRTRFNKVFVPERFFVTKDGSVNLQAASMDKVLANTVYATRELTKLKQEAEIPWQNKNGALTEAGWNKAASDIEIYTRNQANGYAGNGQKVARTTDYFGPAENPSYAPVKLGETESQFINLLMGRDVGAPKTARTQTGVKPRNIAAQELATLNVRPVETSKASKPGSVFKGYGGAEITEMNPLRNRLTDAGFDFRKLAPVTENLSVKNLKGNFQLRPELNFRAPSTDLMRAGFMPAPEHAPSKAIEEQAAAYLKGAGREFRPRGIREARQKISETRKKFPEALPLRMLLNKTGEPIFDQDGKPVLQKTPYQLRNAPGLSTDNAKAAAQAGDKLVDFYNSVKDDPAITAGNAWYSKMRSFFQEKLGSNMETFAQLLGATSANTDVVSNFKQAVEAIQLFSKGTYDDLLSRYDEHVSKAEADLAGGELFKRWRERNPNARDSAYDAQSELVREINSFSEVPLKSNGTKYNMNSKKVLQALYGNWLAQVEGPKTPNFAGNLTGRTTAATIDKWAARSLRRLLYQDNVQKWRILPQAESGVDFGYLKSGELTGDFKFAQDAFKHAAEKVGIEPDDLQAILWYAEKDLWDRQGYSEKETQKKKASFEEGVLKSPLLESERVTVGVTTATASGAGEFDAELASLRKTLSGSEGMLAARATKSEGYYQGGSEPSFDIEATFKKDANLDPVISQVVKIGKDSKREDVFVSVVVPSSHPNARPAVEVGFKGPPSEKQLAEIVKTITDNGINGLTVARDSRGAALSVRMQYVPEISARFDSTHIDAEKFVANAVAWANTARAAVALLDPAPLSYVKENTVSTIVYGKENYENAHIRDPRKVTLISELGKRKSALTGGPSAGATTEPGIRELVESGETPESGVAGGYSGLEVVRRASPGEVQPVGAAPLNIPVAARTEKLEVPIRGRQ